MRYSQLDQAGAYIEATQCGLPGYLELYATQGLDLLKERGLLAPGHPDPVATTWVLSFQKIEQANPAAAELLRFCAFLHPDGIPEELITEGASELGPVLGPVAKNPISFNQAIGEILKFSLIHRDMNNKTLAIHRLVQSVILKSLDNQTHQIWIERLVRAMNQIFPKVKFENWHQCNRMLSNALKCGTYIITKNVNMVEAGRILNQIGAFLVDRAQYSEAEPLHQRALAIRESALGPTHPDVAQSINNLASLYFHKGKYPEASLLYKRSLAILEQTLGPNHPLVSHSLNNLAALLNKLGRYEEAESLYQRALKIREQALGHNHPEVAQILNNLGELYRNQKRYAEAEPLYQRANKIWEHDLGPIHPTVATNLNNLGLLYASQEKYFDAERLYQRALAIREQALGPTHPDVAQSLNNLAALYNNQGKFHQAMPLYQRALPIREQALGPTHPDVAQSLNNLGVLYRNLEKYAEAELLLGRAINIYEEVLGTGHPTSQMVRETYEELQKMNENKNT